MKRHLSIATLMFLTACGGGTNPIAGSAPPSPTEPGPVNTPPSTVDNLSFEGLLNDVRVAAGSGTVAFDARLATAAQNHSNDMLNNNYFSHTGLDGSTPGDRITAAGYNWSTYGENIAQGQTSQAEVLADWENSPGHHANNINPNFEDFGLGKAGTGSETRWVLVLATEQP